MTLRAALLLLLDQVDYTAGACSLMEPVGGVLDANVIRQCRQALSDPRNGVKDANA